MIKKEFYSMYEEEHNKTKTVVHEIGHAIDNYLSSGHVRSYSVESKSPAFTSIKDAIYLDSIDDSGCLDGTLIGEFIEKTIAMA